jgi:hypothetical protein
MGYAVWHWRFYNVLRRLIGLSFVIVGVVGLFSPFWQRLGWADEPPMTRSDIVIGTVVWSIAIAFGLFLCRRVTFRPDLGDWQLPDYFNAGRVRPSRAERRARRWWTGNPRNDVVLRDRDA